MSPKPPTRRKNRSPNPPIPDDDYGRLLPLPRVQEILMCSRQKIYKLFESGLLDLRKFGGQTRVTSESLRALMTGLPPAEFKRTYSSKPKA
jgi:hypothetical protein